MCTQINEHITDVYTETDTRSLPPTDDAYCKPKNDDYSPYHTEKYNNRGIEGVVTVPAGAVDKILILIIVVRECTEHGKHEHVQVNHDDCKRRQRFSNLPDVHVFSCHDQQFTRKAILS